MKQSSHYGLGLVGNLALGFISFPIFTRMFTVADYGLIDFAQKILLLLAAASKVGMQNSALRFFDRENFVKDPRTARGYYSTMFFGVAGLAGGVTLLSAAAMGLLPQSWVDAPLAAILSFTSLLVFLRAQESILWSFLRIEERTKLYNLIGFLMKAGTIAAVLILLPLRGPSVRTYFTAAMSVELLVVLALTIPLFKRGMLRPSCFDPVLFRASFIFGLPLVLQEIFGIILDSGDRFLVKHYLGDNPLGFYSVAYGLSTYINTLMIAPLGLAIVPIYLRLWKTDGREKTIEFLSFCLDIFLLVSAAVMVVVAVASHDAVTLLASSKYRGADRLMPAIVAGLLIYTTQIFIGAGLMIHKKTPAMAGALGVAAVFNVVLNCLLLPRMGLMAAALATLLSYALSTVLLAKLAFKVLPLQIRLRPLCGYGISAAIAWAAVSQLDFGILAVNFVAKAALGVIVYAVLLYLIDSRVRGWASQFRVWLMRQAGMGTPLSA